MTAAALLHAEPTRPARHAVEAVRLLGAEAEVPCHGGRHQRYRDLDYAAGTSALPEVWRAVERFAPWSSSVHRGSGLKSRRATEAFEAAGDVDRLLAAIGSVALDGPAARYLPIAALDEYEPSALRSGRGRASGGGCRAADGSGTPGRRADGVAVALAAGHRR